MKRMKHQEVEVQITPMLDMAFQLLTFFILTYHPAPTEGQFSMNLLPAAPVLDMNAEAPTTETQSAADVPAALRTLSTSLYANPDGTIQRISIGELEFTTVEQLRDRLRQIVADKTLPFDQAVIFVAPDLNYAELVRVIDAFAGPNVAITKLSFAPLDEARGMGL